MVSLASCNFYPFRASGRALIYSPVYTVLVNSNTIYSTSKQQYNIYIITIIARDSYRGGKTWDIPPKAFPTPPPKSIQYCTVADRCHATSRFQFPFSNFQFPISNFHFSISIFHFSFPISIFHFSISNFRFHRISLNKRQPRFI